MKRELTSTGGRRCDRFNKRRLLLASPRSVHTYRQRGITTFLDINELNFFPKNITPEEESMDLTEVIMKMKNDELKIEHNNQEESKSQENLEYQVKCSSKVLNRPGRRKLSVTGGRRYDRIDRESGLLRPRYEHKDHNYTTFLEVKRLNLFPKNITPEEEAMDMTEILLRAANDYPQDEQLNDSQGVTNFSEQVRTLKKVPSYLSK